MTTSMNKPTTTPKMRKQGTIKTKQQLLPKEAFSLQITKFRRERIIPLYKDETWSSSAPIPGNLNLFPESCPARPRKNKGKTREIYRETFQCS